MLTIRKDVLSGATAQQIPGPGPCTADPHRSWRPPTPTARSLCTPLPVSVPVGAGRPSRALRVLPWPRDLVPGQPRHVLPELRRQLACRHMGREHRSCSPLLLIATPERA